MRTSLLKLFGAAVALMLSASSFAIGLGGISVSSALGQPLNANIELVAVGNAEKTSLVARLASPDVYSGAGLEYPYGNKFKFDVESRANGEPYLKVSSAQPVNDPFVSLLVELTWSSGKLLREYTFLLDPPGYVPVQPKLAEVRPVAPAAQAMPETAEAAHESRQPAAPAVPADMKPAESQSASGQTDAAANKMTEESAGKVVAEKQPAAPAKPSAPAPAAEKPGADNITVQRGDTLSKIAMQYKPADVSLERMLVALYRANADQFDGRNMNRIQTGKILRMPDQSELMAVAQSAAVKEIRVQTEDWNAYRQKLSGAVVESVKPQEAKQAATGKITSSVTDKAPLAKESAKEVLKLSKGEAPGDKAAAAGGKAMSAQDKKNAAQEDAIAKSKAEKEDKARAALLQKNLEDMKRLAQLKSEELARTKKEAPIESKPLPPAMSAAPASGVGAAGETKSKADKKPKPAAKPQPKVVVEEPSLLDDPLYLAGGAVVLLGLGGLGYMLARRKKAKVPAVKAGEDIGSSTGHLTAPVAPSPDTGDFTVLAESNEGAEAQTEAVDPISEADLFLNFGRDAQAEEILKDALQNNPNNHQIHLKLLGIYATRKDVNAFSNIARLLQDSGDEAAWHQAAAMGRQIDPGNPMYGSAAGNLEDADSATMQTPAIGGGVPDFMLDETPAPKDAAAPTIDFDLGEPVEAAKEEARGSEQTMILTPEEMAAAQADAMDFDITSSIPSASESEPVEASVPPAEASATNLDDLIFDVTTPVQQDQSKETVKPAEPSPAEDDGMAFTLDFPVDETNESVPAAQPANTGLEGISLNLDEEDMSPLEPEAKPEAEAETEVAAAPAEVRDEHWHEVATKLDLAKAYQEMGDATGAREILEEVLAEGDAGQRETAQAMLDELG